MKNIYNMFIDYEEDELIILKTPSRSPVQVITGKYGIELHVDINEHVVKIVIPEPDILFGVSIDKIESFLIVDSL